MGELNEVGAALEGRGGRMLGHGASADGRYTRQVERFTVHREPLDFRTLCGRVLRPDTRYLLLDLDRTTHRGLNLGELLGWEIASYKFFGPELTSRADAPRVAGRIIHDPARPSRLPGYILDGARRWAFPGLSYLLWGKLAAKSDFLARWSYRKFGPEPIRSVQRLPQTALLHDIATLPKDTLRMLAQRVWDVAKPVQVIERADLDWVRARCPDIRIILTSASPQPIVELAGEMLGVDGCEFSVTRDLGDRYASPYWIDRRFALEELDQLATPREVRINSGHAKIERLLLQYPDLLDEGVESVGISDTGYGEDHAWGQYLSVVIDVNSTAPFPALVAHDSPLREVHSAQLLTHDERTHAEAAPPALTLRAEELASIAHVREALELACAECDRITRELAPARAALQARLAREHDAIGDLVTRHNLCTASERAFWQRALRHRLRGEQGIKRSIAELETPLSYAYMRISALLAQSRDELGTLAAARVQGQRAVMLEASHA